MTNIIEDCKKFLGLPPYNDYSNPVVGDPHYLNSLKDKYNAVLLEGVLENLQRQL